MHKDLLISKEPPHFHKPIKTSMFHITKDTAGDLLVAEETKTPLVDAIQWWKTHEPSMKDFYDNVHPSVSGHRKIGQSLVQTLQEQWIEKQ